MMTASRQSKSNYSETEAAAVLGIPVDELRSLIKLHILKNGEEIGAGSALTFQASDLLILRMLAQGRLANAS